MTDKQKLHHELEQLEEQIAVLETALAVQPDYGMGEGDPAVTQWELDQALLERIQEHASELREAMTRLDAGTYGVCEHCGKPIHPDRLAALSDTRVCVACARK